MKVSDFVKFLLLVLLFSIHPNISKSQFWAESFGNGCNKGDTANTFNSGNGSWGVLSTGTNGNTAHNWFVSATSAQPSGAVNCDQNCQATPTNTNTSLHISNVAIAVGAPINININPDTGAFFVPGGLTAFGVNTQTSKRVESPTINCAGQNNIFIQFNYFEGGTSPNQNATLDYFDGANWITLFDMGKTPTGNCPNLGEWTQTNLIALPASANNNPNVKIGFNWENNNGTSTNPQVSFSVDDINLYSTASPPPVPPIVNFSTITSTSICDGGSVTFQDLTINADSILWSFPGGVPASSKASTPVINYPNAGNYNVTLTAFNANGTSDTTAINAITVNFCSGAPTANFSASVTTICRGDTIDFFDQSSGFPSKWSWFFPGATNRDFDTTQNPIGIVYDTTGLFEVTLVVENGAGQDFITKTNFIRVNSCPKPIADFKVYRNKDTVCVGDIVTFQNLSANADSTLWVFNGADSINLNNKLRPFVIYNTPGLYDVSMVVANSYGADFKSDTNTIYVLEYPTIDAGVNQFIYAGEKTILNADGATDFYYWEPREFLSCYLCQSPQAFPSESTTFFVINYYDNEAICQVSDSIRIIVEEEYFAGIPDIFSPNLDNNNDRLFVMGNGIFNSDLKIFNRLGQLVYVYSPEVPYWDGTFKGRDVDPGVYTYVANVQFINGTTQLLKGSVTLVR